MAFQTTAAVPPTNPRVTIGFSGLMVFKPGANNTCEVGVHRFSNNHGFRAVLIVRKPNRPAIVMPLLTGLPTAPFFIRHLPEPVAGNFRVFAPTADPFNRAAANNNELDYRWAVNLRSIHPNATINSGAPPLVILKTGILYTSNLTRELLDPKLVPHPEARGISDIPLNRLAANMAASIIMPGGSSVQITWGDLGDKVDLLLPRTGDPPNTTYTIFFTNDPPNLNAEIHDELLLFYKVLEENGRAIPDEQRLSLKYNTDEARTDEVPCLTLVNNP